MSVLARFPGTSACMHMEVITSYNTPFLHITSSCVSFGIVTSASTNTSVLRSPTMPGVRTNPFQTLLHSGDSQSDPTPSESSHRKHAPSEQIEYFQSYSGNHEKHRYPENFYDYNVSLSGLCDSQAPQIQEMVEDSLHHHGSF